MNTAWTSAKIQKAFSGRLMCAQDVKKIVCDTLLCLPPELITRTTQGIWFIGSVKDTLAFTFRGSDIENQHLVFLSEELFSQETYRIRFTILHEIGHVILGHRNSMGFHQSQSEIRLQEQEADNFALTHLSSFTQV